MKSPKGIAYAVPELSKFMLPVLGDKAMRNTIANLTMILFASSSLAADIQWNGDGGVLGNPESWQNVDNWDPFGSPFVIHRVPGDGDTATISNPANDIVKLHGNTAPINGLTVNNSAELLTNGHLLQVDNGGFAGSATTAIAGGGTRLWVDERTGGGSALVTDNLLMSGGAQLVMRGGDAIVEGNTTLLSSSVIRTSVPAPDMGSITFGGDVTVVDSGIELAFPHQVNFSPGATVSFQQDSVFDIGGNLAIESGITVDVVDSALSTNSFLDVRGALRVRGSSSWEPDRVNVDGGELELLDFGTVDPFEEIDASNGGQVISNRSLRINGISSRFDKGADFIAPDATLSLAGLSSSPHGGRMTFTGQGTSLSVGSLNVVAGSSLSDSIFLLTDHASGSVENLYVGNNSFSEPRDGSLVLSQNASLQVTNDLFFGTEEGAFGIGRITLTSGGSLVQTGTGTTEMGADDNSIAELAVASGASYASNDQSFLLNPSAIMRVQGGDNRGVVNINGPLTVKGKVDVQADPFNPDELGGALHLNAAATIDGGTVNLSAGVMTAATVSLSSGGAFNFNGGELGVAIYLGDLTNSGGQLSPGTTTSGQAAGSTSIVGDYAQLPGAALAIDIGGTAMITEYDFVDVANNATLGGDLQLSLLNGFSPNPGDSFTILNAGNLLGTFTNVLNGERLSTLDNGGSFIVNYGIGSAFNPDQIVLSNFQANSNPADLSGDGFVDGLDLGILLGNFDQTAGASGGELNGTPPVDGLDLGILLGAWNPPTLTASYAVPEPSMFVLLLITFLFISAFGHRDIVVGNARRSPERDQLCLALSNSSSHSAS